MKKTAILLLPVLLLAVSSAAVDMDIYPIPFISGGSFTAQSHDCPVAATEKTAEKEKVQEQPTPAKAAEPSATAAQAESKAEEQPILETSGKKPGFFARILSFFRNLFR